MEKSAEGIPVVMDRVIQQAICQVLSPIFDPHFSESSFNGAGGGWGLTTPGYPVKPFFFQLNSLRRICE